MELYGTAFAVRESWVVGSTIRDSELVDCSARLRPNELAIARSEEPTPAVVSG